MTRGWHRIMSGWYKYTNESGKTLAYAQRYRSFWNVTVLPMADVARACELPESPHTLREAKEIAERAYLASTKNALARQAADLDKHGH